MRPLEIRWQRLVADGRTCDRCGSTGREVERAVATLRAALAPLGIEPVLETVELDDSTFRARPSLSNEIWVNGRLLDDWLSATTGSSTCCSVCGDAPCRTVQIGEKVFETIPERLLVRAGLLAAAAMLE